MIDGSFNYSIRYEGGDAGKKEIDLNQLGQSLQGFARILAVSAHFCQTGKYNKQFESLSVKVLAKPVGEHHCYEISATIEAIATSKELWSGLGTAVFMAIVGYVFNRRKEQEMKHLSAALDKALGMQERSAEQMAQAQAQMLGTIERLAQALTPAARQALAPVGQSVEHVSIQRESASADETTLILDKDTKERLQARAENAITQTRDYSGVISELDMITGACKVSLESDPDTRIAAAITDPVGQQPGNAYASAMRDLITVRFRAKAETDVDGNVVKLYISDLSE